jgi:hypothetical protein
MATPEPTAPATEEASASEPAPAGSDADFWGGDGEATGEATSTPESDADFWGDDS